MSRVCNLAIINIYVHEKDSTNDCDF